MEETPKVLFCEQLRVLRPRTGAQVQFCAPRAESTDGREASLVELLANCCEARLPAMGPSVTSCFAWPSLARVVVSLLFLRPSLVSLGVGLIKFAP